MVNYTCLRCNYETKFKSSFINHLNRKNICLPTLEDISIEDIKKKYNLDNHLQNPPKSLQNPSKTLQNEKLCISLQNPPKSLQNPPKSLRNPSKIPPKPSKTLQNEKGKAVCEYCLREFTRRDNLTRHYGRCKIKKKEEEQNLKNKEVDNMYNNMNKDVEKNIHDDINNDLNNNISNIDKLTDKLTDKVEDLLIELCKKGKLTNTTNNTIHNTNNKNKIINIHINNFGSENTEYLNKDYLNNLLHGAFTAIPKLIEKIHFNPNHPENHNIKITNKKQPYIKVRKNDKWELHDKKETLETLVDDKYYILEDHYAGIEKEEDVSDHTKDIMEKFRNKFSEDKELQKDIQKQSEMIILNNS